MAGSSQADTIGNPIISGGSVDSCNGCTFVLLDPFPAGDSGDVVTSFSLYAYQSGGTITPLIFSLSGGVYKVTGVGATETVASTGAQTYTFSLSQGSASVGTNTFFGYRDGTVSGGSVHDTISFANGGSGFQIQYFGSAGPGTSPNIYLNESFNPAGGVTVAGGPEPGGLAYSSAQLARTYSLSATAVSASTPEPASVILLGGMLLAVAFAARKRMAA